MGLSIQISLSTSVREDITPLYYNQMKCTVTLNKAGISRGFNIFGNLFR